jgi:beta-N-acetylhexosaminidase
VLTGLLKKELSFGGLIISDAMTMGGLTRYADPGRSELMSLMAGMDVLELVADPETAIKNIMTAIKAGDISSRAIEEKCRKVLAAKYYAGLSEPQVVDKENIVNDLSTKKSEALIRKLYSSAITVLNNDQNIIPVKHLERSSVATLAINSPALTTFQRRISKYIPADDYFISDLTGSLSDSLLNLLENYDIIIAAIFRTDQRSSENYGLPSGIDNFLRRLNNQNKCILTWFGNPYAIDRIPSAWLSAGLILTYQENNFTQDLSAQLIFGAIGAKGSLPVTINRKYPVGSGLITPGSLRIQYGIPENEGISSMYLDNKIDSLAESGIKAGAYPGCEIIVAKDGMVIFQRTYGYQTYDDRTAVSEDDLFDLASVTKVSASMAGLLLLDTEGKFSPDKTLGYYLPQFRRSNKSDMLMTDMLTHQAGLVAWIPFWRETLKKNGKFKARTFKHEYSEKYPVKVANDLYIYRNYNKKIFREIKVSKVSDQKKYLYSDLTFIIVPLIISRLSGEKWYDFVTDSIYHKIGAYDLCFNPYLKYPLSRIIPTEYDSLFRKQLLRGTVHDEGAAMLGGISGHAGLFATANDLMKLMELYRRMGNYGGEQLLDKNIMLKYTGIQFPENNNRRGLGFDKPLIDNSELSQEDSYPTKSASPESFGHSGFTGTFVWMDPKYNLTYIFFCNRVYPTRENNLLTDLSIRSNILQVVYDSILK